MTLTKVQARAQFAATRADGIAHHAGATGQRVPPARGWTTTAVWYRDERTLSAVVGEHEGAAASLALAHGLHLAGGLALHLVLPAGLEGPTLHRLAWLDRDITVTTHDTTGIRPVPVPSRADTLVAAGGPVTAPDLHLGDTPAPVRELTAWAARHPELRPAHRSDVRAWTSRGIRVLTLRRARSGVAVTAGIDATATPALRVTITAAASAAELDTIRAAVEDGIDQARAGTHGPYEEHHLQEVLRLNPHLLGLEHPVLREVPAFRPAPGGAGGAGLGRGYIDLAGLDGNGDIVLVETKLGSDDMLVLQGLDYWIWASRSDNRAWLTSRLHADPARARLRLLYCVGGRMGAAPALDKYATAQLRALHPDVDHEVVLMDGWKTPHPTVAAGTAHPVTHQCATRPAATGRGSA